jgi:hypothetical protein
MTTSSLARHAFPILAAMALLAGCGGGATQIGSSGPTQQSALRPGTEGHSTRLRGSTLAVRHPGTLVVHADHSKSRMAPGAGNNSLLYISDAGTDDVYVYDYPSGAPAGTLTGFDEPQGECVDKAGDVYITSTQAAEVLEYKHGGTTPIATLKDPGESPIGCAYDATTGDIAVSNITSGSGGRGSVSIYLKGHTTPSSIISTNAFIEIYFLSYDSQGNLFLDAIDESGVVHFGEIVSGGSSITEFDVPGLNIGFPGNVQVDSGVLTVGDQDSAVIYQITNNSVSGTTPLTGSSDVVQYFIDGGTVVGPDAGNADAEFYNYPAGGSPTKTITGLSEPIGSAISTAKGGKTGNNHPAEIFNQILPYPCPPSGPCPTDFEVIFNGNVTGDIPPSEGINTHENAFCSPSGGSCAPTVTYNSSTNTTTVEYAGPTLFANRRDDLPGVHFGMVAGQNQKTSIKTFENQSFWTYPSSPPANQPIISINSAQPASSSNWAYAVVYLAGTTSPSGPTQYETWNEIAYVPSTANSTQQPKFTFKNYGQQTFYVTSSGIALNQAVPTDPTCLTNPACQENLELLGNLDALGYPTPGESGSPFVPLQFAPKGVLKPSKF